MAPARRTARSYVALLLFTMSIGVVSATGATAHQTTPRPMDPPRPELRFAVRAAAAAAADRADANVELRRASADARSAAARPTAWIERSTADTPAPKPRTESKSSGGGVSADARASFGGRNKVWIPSLSIRRSVSGFSCSSSAYPGNRVYRWGCAGSNNVYLFGHAHSVFKPLHDAYVRGRLKKGMEVLYADGNGRVSTYKVSWWKVVRPDKGKFAYASQSRPSMTLQTCVGAKSQYRLVVRLTRSS